MPAQIDVQTDGQSRPFGQNRKMLLIYHFNGDKEVIEEKNLNIVTSINIRIHIPLNRHL
jgi:hypothetical protein